MYVRYQLQESKLEKTTTQESKLIKKFFKKSRVSTSAWLWYHSTSSRDRTEWQVILYTSAPDIKKHFANVVMQRLCSYTVCTYLDPLLNALRSGVLGSMCLLLPLSVLPLPKLELRQLPLLPLELLLVADGVLAKVFGF